MYDVTITMPVDIACRAQVELEARYRTLLTGRIRTENPDYIALYEHGLRENGEAIVALDVARHQWMNGGR